MITERRRREPTRDGYGRRIFNTRRTQFCDGKNEAFRPLLKPYEAEPDRRSEAESDDDPTRDGVERRNLNTPRTRFCVGKNEEFCPALKTV